MNSNFTDFKQFVILTKDNVKINEKANISYFNLTSNLLFNYLEFEDALDRMDKTKFEKSAGEIYKMLSYYLGQNFRPEAQIFDDIYEIVWKPQYAFTNTTEELKFFKLYLKEIVKSINHFQETGSKINNHNVAMKDLITRSIKAIVSICLNFNIPPLKVLIDSLNNDTVLRIK